MKTRLFFRIASTILCVCAIALVASTNATAQTYVATTGTVDPSSLTSSQFVNGAAYVKPGLATGTVILRFNVLPVGDLLVPVTQACCEERALLVRYMDNGAGARVTVVLKRYNVFTGVISTLITFDSNNFAPASGFQLSQPPSSEGFFNFSFASGPFSGNNQGGDSVYFLEATLTRSAAGGNPALASISIVRALAP